MCRSMVDILCAAADIRRGKKEDRKKPKGNHIVSASAMQGSHKNADRLTLCLKLVPALRGS